jgi:hypothetical protein
MAMSARSRIHLSKCSELSRCVGVGAAPSEKCQQFDHQLDQVIAEAFHEKAKELRALAEDLSSATRTGRIQRGTLRKVADGLDASKEAQS